MVNTYLNSSLSLRILNLSCHTILSVELLKLEWVVGLQLGVHVLGLTAHIILGLELLVLELVEWSLVLVKGVKLHLLMEAILKISIL